MGISVHKWMQDNSTRKTMVMIEDELAILKNEVSDKVMIIPWI